MANPSLLLFGPVSVQPSQAHLSQLRTSIIERTDLKFLSELIDELPNLWSTIVQNAPQLDSVPGEEQLNQLRQFLISGSLPNADALGNVMTAPLTIIFQISELVGQQRDLGKAKFPRLENVQGFCLGFLTAAAVASSQNATELQEFASVAVRLAVCIGSVVDLDEISHEDPSDRSASIAVRWRSETGKDDLENILRDYPKAYISCVTDENSATVTIPLHDEGSFAGRLTEMTLLGQPIGLRGRYHHPDNIQNAQQLKDLCRHDKRFQLPSADRVVLSLRSNSNTKVITDGALHDVAIDSILAQQSKWFQTVRATVAALGTENIIITSVGTGSFIPYSITTASLTRSTPATQRGRATEGQKTIDGPALEPPVYPIAMEELESQTQSSLYPTPTTESDSGTASTPFGTSAIAVVGMACRFPEAESLEAFWQLITSGANAVRSIPKERFEAEQLWRDPKGPFWGNFIGDPEAFDHRFFSIAGREAKSMDPQQRLLLQVVYEAMESSGYYGPQSAAQPNDIGCYVGVGSVDYEDNVSSENATAFSALGTLRAFISGRAIQSGECSMAVAGGVNVITSPKLFQNLSAGGFLNPTGASKAFDAKANGYCRGEGAGIMILKPLERANADHDFVLGVIGGSAVNQGSNCTPITVPVTQSQSALYRQALSYANIKPQEISYVEAHGTGTPVGDPIECESIRQTFGGSHRDQQLFIGSVKDNIGHAEAASGAAGVIKTLLMMQNRMIPKQANFVSLNPAIPSLEADRMAISKHTQSWDAPRRNAVVNNYGAAGSNVAIVLQEQNDLKHGTVEPSETPSPHPVREFPIIIQAKSPERLRTYCTALRSFVAKAHKAHRRDLLANVAYNLAKKQNRSLEFSFTFTADSIEALEERLEAASLRSDNFNQTAGPGRPVVLCFGGQSGRQVHLSEDLYRSSRILQTHMDRCNSVCKLLGLPSIFPGVFRAQPVEDLIELHCRLFCIQYACAKSWIDCGLKVDTLIGHSFGQLTALCVAGSFSLEDGLRFISTRARLIRDRWGSDAGAMVAVEGDLQQVEDLVDSTTKRHSSYLAAISCYNGPRSFVLAGTEVSIEAIERTAATGHLGTSLKLQRLKNTHAFHSHLVDSISPELEEMAASMRFQTPAIHVETCSQNQSWSKVDAKALTQQSRLPVYFTDAVDRIEKRLTSCIWLEAGPFSPVIAMTRRTLQSNSSAQHTLLPVDLASANTQSTLARTSSELWAAGSEAQFWPFHGGQKDVYEWLNLPPYQFEKTRHWIDYKETHGIEPSPPVAATQQKPELLQKVDGNSVQNLFSIDSTHSVFELCTRGHAVLNHSLCPASMYFELAVRAASAATDPTATKKVPQIEKLEISSPLSISPAGSVFLRLIKDTTRDETWKFSFFSRSQPDAAQITTHASGSVALLPHDAAETTDGFQSLNRLVGISRCENIINAPTVNGLNGAIVYKNFGRVVDYASYYRGVKRIFAKDMEAVGHVTVPEEQPSELGGPGYCDPVAIDNFLQVSGIHINCLWDCRDDEVFVCTAIRDLSFSEQFMNKSAAQRSWTVYSNSESKFRGQVINDIFVLDSESGELVLALLGAKFTSLPLKSLSKTLAKLNGSPKHDSAHCAVEHDDDAPPAPRDDYEQPDDAQTLVSQDDLDTREDGRDQNQVFEKLQAMLSEVLEISVDDVQPGSALGDLGVDSLMTTEVLSEIKSRFDVEICNAEFQELTDLQSLCGRIQPSAPESTSKTLPLPQKPQTQADFRTHDAQMFSKQNSGITSEKLDAPFAVSARKCFDSIKVGFDAAAGRTKFLHFSQDVYPLQKELVVAYVVEAFTALGCRLASLRSGQHLPEIQYEPRHSKVVSQYYRILEDARLITQTERGSCRTGVSLPQQPAQSLHDTLVKKFPQHVSEHNLLNTTGPKLAQCLTEREDPIALLFGSAKARALMTDVYTNAPMFKAGTQVLAQYLEATLSQIDYDREIRILELGAGTGGTTSYLIESLIQSHRKFRYTFTDLSSSLVAAAKKKFAQHQFMDYATLDIEQEPQSQQLGRYDVILSTNCIHATKNLTASTTNIRKMLKPDGLLCLVELTRNLFWFDLVFGLLEGWWLFDDGRKHALATEGLWEHDLQAAGFNWVDWTESQSQESQILRLIVASPFTSTPSVRHIPPKGTADRLQTQETVNIGQKGDTQLLADVYYPDKLDNENTVRPVATVAATPANGTPALMIHGGGHVMLSRQDVRPQQTQTLLKTGFLPISIDYRLCPETTLVDGPMRDVCSAHEWARCILPSLQLKRTDIRPDGDRVVAIGWSTGGHLAMTLAWTAPAAGVAAPNAILAFYCPTDYEDGFWTRPNVPRGSEKKTAEASHNLLEGVQDSPITAYNPPASARALGGWMAPEDPRSQICLHMNWKGQALPILLNGLKPRQISGYSKTDAEAVDVRSPTKEQVMAVSPLAQIRKGTYRTPTFIVHGTRDDLIPWEQAQRTYDGMVERGVEAELRIVEGGIHLFDTAKDYRRDEKAAEAVDDGYRFLQRCVKLA
ncbi:MAG: hypothetical protein Q9198_000074 [Flavoplaca austrocitrina]